MNERWKDFISSWGSLPVGGNLGLPAAPTQLEDDLRRPLWPTTVGEASWVPTPVSPTPPQGGLFSSLTVGARDGILGQLAPPPEYLNSGRYWGAAAAPPRTSASPTRVGDYYLSPAPPAPDWNAIASRASMRAAQPFLESPSRSSWMVPADNPEAGSSANSSGGEAQGISQVLSDATSDDHWIWAQTMRVVGTIKIRERFIESFRFRRKHGKYLTRRQPAHFHSLGGTNTMISIAYTIMRSKNS